MNPGIADYHLNHSLNNRTTAIARYRRHEQEETAILKASDHTNRFAVFALCRGPDSLPQNRALQSSSYFPTGFTM
jgi:hypothetical protein